MEDNNHPKDYYKIFEVDYDANEEMIKLKYRKLALKWHPDKHNGDTMATSKFQEINEAYNALMDPALRFEYDLTGIYEIHKYTLREYLATFKEMILTCNGLGISHSSPWTQQLAEGNNTTDEKGYCIPLIRNSKGIIIPLHRIFTRRKNISVVCHMPSPHSTI